MTDPSPDLEQLMRRLELLAASPNQQLKWAHEHREPAEEIGLLMLDAIDVFLPNIERQRLLTLEQAARFRALGRRLAETMPSLFNRRGGLTEAPEWGELRSEAAKLAADMGH